MKSFSVCLIRYQRITILGTSRVSCFGSSRAVGGGEGEGAGTGAGQASSGSGVSSAKIGTGTSGDGFRFLALFMLTPL